MRLTALVALALCCAPLAAQQPVPAPPGIDGIAGKITDIDKQTSELAKQRAALVGDLRAELKRIADVVEKLNLSGPAPAPPAPPVPVPPIPPAPPADPLKTKLKAVYDADPAQLDARRGQALSLAALYKQAGALAVGVTVVPATDSAPEQRVYTVLTSGDLLTRVRDAAKSLVGADALKGVRTAASTELGALLPTDAPLTVDQRTAVAALFLKLATAIEEIVK